MATPTPTQAAKLSVMSGALGHVPMHRAVAVAVQWNGGPWTVADSRTAEGREQITYWHARENHGYVTREARDDGHRWVVVEWVR